MTFITPLILFFINGFISLIITNKKALSGMFFITALLSLVYNSYSFTIIQNEVSYIFGNFSQDLGIEYTANSFKLSISLLLCVIFFLFSIFINGFTKNFKEQFSFNILFCLINIMCGSAIAIIFTNDLFNFYIFLELLAICSYTLTSFGKKGATYASLNYLFLGIIASGFLVLGIGVLYFTTGYLNITKVANIINTQTSVKPIIPFVLILIGFLIKLAIFPFSFWPGLVYKYFPNSLLPLYGSVVSVVTMYGFFLFQNKFFILNIEQLQIPILVLTSAGVLLFSFFSLFENNIKKVLAYSTISQVSYVLFLLFINNDKTTTLAFLHLFSNSLSKFVLFMILFEVLKERQNFVISKVDNLLSRSKFLSISMLIFFANIVGLPIMFGFFTKSLIVINLFSLNSYPFILIILIGAVLNFIYFWRIANIMFYSKNPIEDCDKEILKVNIESKITITSSTVILVLGIVFFSPLNQFLNSSILKFY